MSDRQLNMLVSAEEICELASAAASNTLTADQVTALQALASEASTMIGSWLAVVGHDHRHGQEVFLARMPAECGVWETQVKAALTKRAPDIYEFDRQDEFLSLERVDEVMDLREEIMGVLDAEAEAELAAEVQAELAAALASEMDAEQEADSDEQAPGMG